MLSHIRCMRPYLLHEVIYATPFGRHRFDNRWKPRKSLAVEIEHHAYLGNEPFFSLAIRFVDDENIGNLHDARFERLDIVTEPRNEGKKHRIGDRKDINFALTDADRLDDDRIETSRTQEIHHIEGCRSESPETATACHAPNEHSGIFCMCRHPDTITEDRTAGERRTRIHRDDSDNLTLFAQFPDDSIGKRAFTRTGRTGDTDNLYGIRVIVVVGKYLLGTVTVVLYLGKEFSQRTVINGAICPYEIEIFVFFHRRRLPREKRKQPPKPYSECRKTSQLFGCLQK